MIKVNAMGDTCPIPVVKTKNAIKELKGSGEVQTLVDNEIAVQNLTKMANQKGYYFWTIANSCDNPVYQFDIVDFEKSRFIQR